MALLFLKLLHDPAFFIRLYAGPDLVQAQLLRHRLRRHGVIAGHHHQTNAFLAQQP
jgi:hypothetical protein